MLRTRQQYSEGLQSSSGKTLRNSSKGNISDFRIIYIISLFTTSIRNQYRQCRQYCENSLFFGILGDIIGCISLMVLFFLTLFLAGIYQ
mgnify:CR=1 FL=1